MENLSDILIPLGFMAAVVLSLFYYYKTRNQERMAMIEKGLELPEKRTKTYMALKTGIFFIGLALGLFFGYLLKTNTKVDDVISFFVMVLLFGGISLVVNHFITLKLDKK